MPVHGHIQYWQTVGVYTVPGNDAWVTEQPCLWIENIKSAAAGPHVNDPVTPFVKGSNERRVHSLYWQKGHPSWSAL